MAHEMLVSCLSAVWLNDIRTERCRAAAASSQSNASQRHSPSECMFPFVVLMHFFVFNERCANIRSMFIFDGVVCLCHAIVIHSHSDCRCLFCSWCPEAKARAWRWCNVNDKLLKSLVKTLCSASASPPLPVSFRIYDCLLLRFLLHSFYLALFNI